MNFNELMNDDTCQILLAIIVGIVICYFIFGTGTGSCNRDGFSVGGETCTAYLERIAPVCGGEPYQDAGLDEQGIRITGEWGPGDQSQTQCCQVLRSRASPLDDVGSPMCQFETDQDSILDSLGQDGKSFRDDLIRTKGICDGSIVYTGAGTPPPPPPAAGAGGQSLSVENIREKNIMDSIKNMIQKVAIGNLNQNILEQLNLIQDTSSGSFNILFHIGKELNLEFIILVNTDNVASLSKNDFVNLIKNVYISQPEVPAPSTQRRIRLGNMFDPYARLSTNDKKEIYCSKNTLTTSNEGQEKYDQLLKMRSSDEGSGLLSNLSCDGQDGWESSINKMYDIAAHPGAGMELMTEYGDMINNSLQGTTVPADMTTAIDGVLDITSIGAPRRYNDTQMVIIDKFDNSRFPNDRIMKPKYIEIIISKNIVNIRGDDNRFNTIGRGNYQLLFMDGMSSNGTPYNEKIDAFDKSNLYNAYYKNLFFVQYLIFKIFLGTGRYVPRATSFLVTDPGKRNDDIGAREYSNPHPNWYDDTNPDGALNNMCTSSGRDYLVLGLLKEHTHAQSAAESRMNKHTIGQRPEWDPTMPRINSIDRNGSIFTEGATARSRFDFSPQSQEEYLDQYPVLGCTNATAANFNSGATIDNGSCDVNCVETGNTPTDCTADCTPAIANVITPAANDGTPCTGDYTCNPGDGECPAPTPPPPPCTSTSSESCKADCMARPWYWSESAYAQWIQQCGDVIDDCSDWKGNNINRDVVPGVWSESDRQKRWAEYVRQCPQ